MRLRSVFAGLSGSILAASAPSSGALAQEVLPEIEVIAESPLRRVAPAPGAGPVVADTFSPTTVTRGEELRATGGATLGDVLFNKPGITSSTYAPGAASRPIVRGLDNNRVRIQENGVGSADVSALGEDHGVTIDPLAAEQVEVVRGPATLRWGSQAIGGVIEASNNRIPESPGAKGLRFETRSAVTSVDGGREGGFLLDASGDRSGVHMDAFTRAAGDYSTPDGKQANSGARSGGASLGYSSFFDGGFAGLSITHFRSLYEIPGVSGAANRTRIDMAQTKIAGKGEIRPGAWGIDSVRWWFGATNYTHSELGPDAMGDYGPRSTFRNREQEARVEIRHVEIATPFGALRGAFGAQAGFQRLAVSGEGLLSPSTTQRTGLFVFEELALTPSTKIQAAGRIESVRVKGFATDFPPGFLSPPDEPGELPRARSFTPMSVSLGLQHRLPWDMVASVNAQYVERAPQAAELFSKGPHDATATFEIGNPDLRKEAARSLEVSLKRAAGPLRFEATAYMTKFNGFIFKRLTGVKCDDEFATCGAGTELDQIVYSQQNATFRGVEASGAWDIGELGAGVFGVDAQYDLVRARFADGTNVPRIPPQRLGGGVFWKSANWFARASLLHAFAQRRVSPNETPTAGYNILNAELRYTRKLDARTFGFSSVNFALSGTNLLDQRIRNHASFLKDEVLLPGRGARLSTTFKF